LILCAECIVRLSQDTLGATAQGGPRYLLAALALLPEGHHGAGGAGGHHRFGPAAGLVGGSIPLSQQSWQVLLLGWRESAAASAAATERPKLIAQPIRFPIGAVCGDAALGYAYRSAALVDVHLAVDSARGVAVLTTCWRAEAVSEVPGQERVLFESLVGRTEVPLQELRAQEYTPPGPTGAGPSRLSELVAPSDMELSQHGAEQDHLSHRAEDGVVRRHLEELCRGVSAVDAIAEAERTVQTSMLQRVFLSRRYSNRTVCAAYDALAHKYLHLDDGVEETKSVTAFASTGAPLSLDKRTPFSHLPLLVLQLCRRVAAARLQRAQGAGPAAGLRDSQHHRSLEHSKKYLQLLLNTFESFLRECDTVNARATRATAGSLSCVAGDEGFAVQAHHYGEYSVTRRAPVAAVDSGLQHHGLAAKLWGLIEAQCAAHSDVQPAFAELSFLLDRALSDGPVSAGSVLWIEQYFASLVPALPALIAALPPLNGTACLDALTESLCPTSEWQVLAEDTLQRLTGQETAATIAGSTSPNASAQNPNAVLQLLLVVLKRRVRRCMLTLTLFAAYSHGTAARISTDVASALRSVYIPTVSFFVPQYVCAVSSCVHYALCLSC
jgi:hypothetical protein